jgi:hypothetical protein
MNRVGAVVGLMLCLACSAMSAQPRADWREAPEFVRLFGPGGARDAAYRAYVSPLDLDVVLTRLRTDSSLLRPPGAWQPRATSPLDAFGQIGSYNRWQLVQLYGGTAPRVARGPRGENATVTESWTLISPYPDTTWQNLHQGTLLLVVRVAR